MKDDKGALYVVEDFAMEVNLLWLKTINSQGMRPIKGIEISYTSQILKVRQKLGVRKKGGEEKKMRKNR